LELYIPQALLTAGYRFQAREEVSNQGTKSVYVMHSRARGSASGEGQSHAIRLASHSDSTRMTRRGLDDPIDEPDSEDSKQNDVQAQQTDDPEDESTEESEDEGDRNEDSQLQKRGYYVDDVVSLSFFMSLHAPIHISVSVRHWSDHCPCPAPRSPFACRRHLRHPATWSPRSSRTYPRLVARYWRYHLHYC
jgi:hypothetical protein